MLVDYAVWQARIFDVHYESVFLIVASLNLQDERPVFCSTTMLEFHRVTAGYLFSPPSQFSIMIPLPPTRQRSAT
jgi:hypothetical protein